MISDEILSSVGFASAALLFVWALAKKRVYLGAFYDFKRTENPAFYWFGVGILGLCTAVSCAWSIYHWMHP